MLDNRRALNPCRNIFKKIYKLLYTGDNFKISKQRDNDLEQFESFKDVLWLVKVFLFLLTSALTTRNSELMSILPLVPKILNKFNLSCNNIKLWLATFTSG